MAANELLAAYLFVGADELKREFLVDRLTARMASLGDLDFNKDVFQAAGAAPEEVVASCNTLPFMSERRLVIVKDVDKGSKALSEALTSYLADPAPTTVVALTATKLAKNTRLYKAVAKVGAKAVVSCEPKSRRDLPAQVRDLALSNGISITQPAAVELIAMVGESTVHLDTELKKMASALGRNTTVGVDHVHKYVTRTSEVKPWEFTAAFAARDVRKAAAMLAAMPSQSVFGLLAQCVARLRELIIAKELGSQAALASELGLPEWRVRDHGRWARGFTLKELEHALVSAAELECQMKSGGDQELLFERWVLEVCSRG